MGHSHFKRAAHYCGACSIVAITAVLAAAPAAAQENKAAALDEVVVTARKVTENLQDVPVAVTAFTSEDLQKQNALKITDVGRLTPGITLRQATTNPSGMLIGLRGQFQKDTISSVDPSVGTYVDGVYWARSYGLNADLVDLQSVQVLKGPQGTLFGRNTTGGAILLQTNDPQYDKVSGMASVTYGRFNERTGTAVLNLPIVKDRVALRGALQINKRDGYITDIVTGRKYDDRDNITGRLKLGIQATEDLSFVFSAERFQFQQTGQARGLDFLMPGSAADVYIAEQGTRAGLTGPGYVAFSNAHPSLVAQNAGPGQSPAPVNAVPDSRYSTETYSGTGTLDTGIGTFKLIGAYRGTKGHSALDLEGSPWFVHQTYGFQNLKQYSAELQLTGKTLGDALDYAAGVFWFKEDGDDANYSYQFAGGQASSSPFASALAYIGFAGGGEIDNKSAGAYGQATWHATDRLSLTGGLRYSADDRGIVMRTATLNALGGFLACNFTSLGATPDGAGGCTPVSRSASFSNVSYLVSADYRLTDDVMIYGRYSKGYRSGGVNLRATTAFNFTAFGPEIVHDAEVGVKSELFDRRLRLNAAAFRSTLDGAQRSTIVASSGGGTQSIFGNAARVRVWGLEAQATAVLGGGFKISATGAITKPKYLSYNDATGDRSAERFDGIAEEQFSLTGDYDRDMGFALLNLHADYNWAGKTPLDDYNKPGTPFNDEIVAANTAPAGGVANVRASLSFDDGRYEVAAFGRNIFDNRDLVSTLQVIAFGYVGAQYREPATFGLQGTYRFGQ